MLKTFRVLDMHCPKCVRQLEGLKDGLSGVQRITATHENHIMEVEFDETQLSVEQIIAAATALGFHPELIPAD